MAAPGKTEAQSVETFETNIVQLAGQDEELNIFGNVAGFKEKRFFVKTSFHEAFIEALEIHRQNIEDRELWIYESGLKGLGKTSSLLYYVLKCRSQKDTGVHYIDLHEVEKNEEILDAFTEVSKNFKRNDCMIIDHITLYNSHFTKKIEEIVRSKVYKYILIETGFTASAHQILHFGKEYQLNKSSFSKIWNGSLESLNQELQSKGEEVYEIFSECFIMTPRLLHDVINLIKVYKDIQKAFSMYSIQRKVEISRFKDCPNNEVFSEFQDHTRVLLRYIGDYGEHIFTEKQSRNIMIAINVFEIKHCKVCKEDLDTNVSIMECGLREGDRYIKVKHLEPFLADEWHRRLPYKIELANSVNFYKLLSILFTSGGPRKEFEELFVKIQKENETAVLPRRAATTSYEPSKSKCDVRFTTDYKMVRISAEIFFALESLPKHYLKDIPGDLKGSEKNVALFSAYMKELVESHNEFMVYPLIENFMGIDYFVYTNDSFQSTEPKEGDPSSPKRLKDQGKNVLYLVQVATGSSHTGETIGRALDIVKKIFSCVDVTVHVVVVAVIIDGTPFPLTQCSFKNITVLNLYSEKNAGALHKVAQSNQLFYNLYLQLVETKRKIASDFNI